MTVARHTSTDRMARNGQVPIGWHMHRGPVIFVHYSLIKNYNGANDFIRFALMSSHDLLKWLLCVNDNLK